MSGSQIVRTILCTILLSLVGSPAAPQTQESQSSPAVKLAATLVSVPLIVSDDQGRYIPGLKVSDFSLFDERVPQQIAFFDAAEEPINVALLLDTSLSTARVLDDIKDAALSFVRQLRPGDKAMIVTFDRDVHTIAKLSADRKTIERAIRNTDVGHRPGTALRDAIDQVANHDFKKIDGRKAIVLLTDGKDHGSLVDEHDLLDSVAESGSMIYSVFYDTSYMNRDRGRWRDRFPGRGRFPNDRRGRGEQKNEDAEQFLSWIAEASAGRFYNSKITDLGRTFESIGDELRHQYRLGFYPDARRQDGKVHILRVQVSRSDAVVRARRSYLAE